jgi:hypothetical protein
LISIQDAVLYATTSEALSVIFTPLCVISPRILLHCIIFILKFKLEKKDEFKGYHKQEYGSNGNTSSIENKVQILRSIVACQQALALLFSSSHLGSYFMYLFLYISRDLFRYYENAHSNTYVYVIMIILNKLMMMLMFTYTNNKRGYEKIFTTCFHIDQPERHKYKKISIMIRNK